MTSTRSSTYAPSKYYVLKVAGRCNINCTYCYMYNKGDESYRARPRVMPLDVAMQATARIIEYAKKEELPRAYLVLHGGEPLLVGKRWMEDFLTAVQAIRPAGIEIRMSVQTNATLLDSEWIEMFSRHGVHVGVSIDGPPEWHDQFRIGFDGRGTYDATRRGIDLLRESGASFGALAVANPGYDAARIYRHLRGLGITKFDFLWPDYNHDAPPPWPAGRLAKFFIELFDAWYAEGNPHVELRWFESVMLLALGEGSLTEGIGGGAVSSVVVETDGSLQPLDVLRICGDSFTEVGLNVITDGVDELRRTGLYQAGLRCQDSLSDTCRECRIVDICGGGYLPSRWSAERGFRNVNVHCADLYEVISYIMRRVRTDLEDGAKRLASTSGGSVANSRI